MHSDDGIDKPIDGFNLDNEVQNLKPTYDAGKSVLHNAKEAVKFNAALNTLKDDKFVNVIESEIKDDIIENTRAERKIQQIEMHAERIHKEQLKDVNFYDKHKPILSFGGLDEPCDLLLMKITFFLTVVPYFLISLLIKMPMRFLNILFEEINKLLLSIAKFSTPAKLFSQTMFWTGILLSILMLIFFLLENTLNIKII